MTRQMVFWKGLTFQAVDIYLYERSDLFSNMIEFRSMLGMSRDGETGKLLLIFKIQPSSDQIHP